MPRKLKMAVVGTGRLGRFHAQKLAASDRVELVGVADPAASHRDRVAAECGCAAFAEHTALFGRIDAAIVAAPTKWHYLLAMDLIERGIHVLVEKPLCASLAEADELVAAARRRGVVLQAGHVERFNPAFRAAAQHAAEPKYIEALRASPFTFRSTDVGVVLDLMIHDLDLVLALAGSPVRRVEALGVSVVSRHEDAANARIEFQNGCVASLSASRVSYVTARHMQVWTARSFAAIDFAARAVRVVRPSDPLLHRGIDPEAFARGDEDRAERFAREHLPRTETSFEAVDALALESDDFVSAVLEGGSPLVPGEAGRDALAVAEQVLAEVAEHAWDGTLEGRVGPRLEPGRGVLSAPHFSFPVATPQRKAAG